MIMVYESPVEKIFDEEETVEEQILVYKFNNENEAEMFSILSHDEQIMKTSKDYVGEELTPNTDHGRVVRYYFDTSDIFVVVRKNVISW